MEEKNQNKNIYLVAGSILLAAVFIAGAIIYTKLPQSYKESDTARNTAPSVTQERQGTGQKPSVDINNWPFLGSNNAKVVVVEYADYACPFCGRFWQETLPQLKKDYIDTGKVKFVYKDFIVVGGDMAAEAAHCAAEQGKFWEYHDLLYARQMQDRVNWSNPDIHRGYAKELGLNEDALIECFESRKYQEKVLKSSQEAQQNGAQGTPYFLINNIPIFGAQQYSVFKEAIDSLVSR